MLKVFDFEHTPIVDIVNEILVDASSRGASDIHFDPKDNIMQIRIRIDGGLVDYATVPEEYIKNLITRIKIISGMNITESRLPQDGAIKGKVKDIELDLRVSSINTNKGEKIVIRILDYTLSLNGIENLGFSDYNYKKVIEMINEPNGIILVTGATGTGKTTTVYSMLQRLSNDSTNIMSIEDPVEMDIDNVNQIQVNPDIGLTFATALRSILRQDPNIIMIGEIRDSETATIAIRASVTGHLVLSTLHTNDSLSTIERLMDMDVEKYLLAEALSGIISQRLARRLCPHCKKLRKTSKFEKDLIKKTLDMDVKEVYEAVGCSKCNHGYRGRIAFQEVLIIDQKIQDALSMNIRKDKLRNLVYNDNVITLLQDGMIKVVRGDTTIEELLRLIDLDEENAESFKLDKNILNNELNKKIELHSEAKIEKEDNNIEIIDDGDEIIEEELIVPDTDDVVIDSLDATIEDNEDNDDDIDSENMEALDNDEDFINKIEEELEEETKDKKKKKKRKGIFSNKNEDSIDENVEAVETNDELVDKENADNNEEIEKEDNNNSDLVSSDEVVNEEVNQSETLNNDESKPSNELDNNNLDNEDNDKIEEEKIETNNKIEENSTKEKKSKKKKKKEKKKKDLDPEKEEELSNISPIIDETSDEKMESLDNDEDFINKIDEQLDNNMVASDNETNTSNDNIEDTNSNEEISNTSPITEELESFNNNTSNELENDNKLENDENENIIDEKPKKKKEKKKRKGIFSIKNEDSNEETVEAVETNDELVDKENADNEIESKNEDNNELKQDNKLENDENENIVDEKPKKKKEKKKRKSIFSNKNEDSNEETVEAVETNDELVDKENADNEIESKNEDNNELKQDNKLENDENENIVDEKTKKKREKRKKKNSDSDENSSNEISKKQKDTIINNDNKSKDNSDITDTESNNDIDATNIINIINEIPDKSTESNSSEISESEISELEQAIENIEISEDTPNEILDNNDEKNEVNQTIEISINNETDESDVAQVKTIKSIEKNVNTMDTLDYNIDFIDKIYDTIEKNRIIEKDNIDHEKLEKLEMLQDNIGSRVSRMLNKKRYKKKKSDE